MLLNDYDAPRTYSGWSFCSQLAENLRLLRECRFANLCTLESLEALGQLSAPPPPDSDSAESEASSDQLPDAGEQSAEAENRVAQRAVLRALRLTQQQIAAVLEVCMRTVKHDGYPSPSPWTRPSCRI